MKQGIFRIARTSARLEVNGSYFKLHQPGACITPAQLVGALEEIWSGQLLPENPNRKFKSWRGMSGCRSLDSYAIEWRRAEYHSTTVFDVRLPLAKLYISMAGKLNAGAEGIIPEALALCQHFEIQQTPIRLIEEERQEIRYSIEDRNLQGLQVEVRVLSAPDGQVLEEEILSVRSIGLGSQLEPVRTGGGEIFFLDEQEVEGLSGDILDATSGYMLPVEQADQPTWAVGALLRAAFPTLGEAPFVLIRIGGDSEN